jgi:DNA-binding response OmpR family regulator
MTRNSATGKSRILLVDDEPSILKTLKIALSSAGYEVQVARDGVEGSRLWRDKGADLVIADIYMPNKSGLELIKELRAESPATPVIAMTDGGRTKQFNLLSFAKLVGAVRTIAKPFALEEMLAMAKQELDGRSMKTGDSSAAL